MSTLGELFVGDIPAVQRAFNDPPAASTFVTTLWAGVRELLEIERNPPLDAGVES